MGGREENLLHDSEKFKTPFKEGVSTVTKKWQLKN